MMQIFDSAYRRLFEALVADTVTLNQEAYRLRYQVYCVEHDFLDPRDNAGGLERDLYDDHAVQAVLRHRVSGRTVGSVRLILHEPGAQIGCLPIHEVCKDPRVRDADFMPLENTCEISRFAISKEIRHSMNLDGGARRRGDNDAEFSWLMPYITLGLMSMALQMGVSHGITSVCAIMHPALLRLVGRFGLHFSPLGPPILYHGWRQPCFARVDSLLRGAAVEQPEIWQFITRPGPMSFEPERSAVA
jgi:N-acyl amino acid synthase of PEP-CTERM/exosortase system